MTSRAYKSEGEKVNYLKKGGRKEKREGEKAGPATMTSRAYKIKKKGGGGVEKEEKGIGGTCHNDKPGL